MSAVAGPPLPSARMINTRHGPVAIHERAPMQRPSLQPPPLLLLHANPGDSRDYDAVAPALSQNFRTIAVDWPGYGSSPSSHPEQLTAMAFADCLEDLISALKVSAPQRSCQICLSPCPLSRPLQLPSVLIVGNSVGGYAAARFASRHQGSCAAIVLVNTGGFTPHNAFTRAFCRLQGSELVSRCAGRRMAGHYLHRRTPTVESMLQRAAEVSSNPSRLRAHAAVWRSFIHPDHDLRAIATAIRTPTYVELPF